MKLCLSLTPHDLNAFHDSRKCTVGTVCSSILYAYFNCVHFSEVNQQLTLIKSADIIATLFQNQMSMIVLYKQNVTKLYIESFKNRYMRENKQ